MKLTGGSDRKPLSEAWAYVSAEEAGSSDPGWHHHLGGGDGSPELTIAIVK